jgi:uncharacterized membrane protein YfcA
MEQILILIFTISIVAGFIDAIAGGGGLIMLPAFIFTGMPPQIAIATNKLVNVSGTSMSAFKFWKAGTVNWKIFSAMIIPALMGAVLGSYLIGILDRKAAGPVISGLLILVALIVLFKPDFGSAKSTSKPSLLNLAIAGLCIGVHDGFFGPGAGVFLIFSMIHFGGSNFLGATSTAKMVNLFTSLIALIAFIRAGQVNWEYGIVASVGVVIGSYFGAGHAGRIGTKIIKPIFLCMAVSIAVKIMY